MDAPDGFEYTIAGRNVLMCSRCGTIVGYAATDKHDTYHKALFYAGLERFFKTVEQGGVPPQ